ncbi:C40 family peptidase [Streptomyces candidus]|uniref:Cell wall-associated NlpC family hydrolase n=1 Tax=Streptomyces candidus TaxID=67283 RepID=A0A7X0HC29_9ACTN|nr:C40 family peptidase [Streptomyces candidus]MBB6434825.1 cell wall-associated NlpC family hydrolase [Streptomyces candidus]
MSHTAHIPSHRKPRRSASKMALRAGVAGGVLSTIAVAGAAAPAHAEPVHETVEMPTLTTPVAHSATTTAAAVTASAEATQALAFEYDREARQQAAATDAMKDAKQALAEADRKAEAEKKAEQARKKAEEKAEQERASRSSARTDLSSYSGSSSAKGTNASASSSSSPSTASSSQATGSAASVIAFARAQVGDAYVMGSTGPNAWDCSGLMQAAFRTIGVDLPRVSQGQSTAGTQVGLDNLQPGDILYWGAAGSAYHVGVYVGGGNFVGAQNSSTGVVERPLSYDPPTGAVRVL